MTDDANGFKLIGGLSVDDLTSEGFAVIKNAGVSSQQLSAPAPAIAGAGFSLAAAYAENERLIEYLAKARAWGHGEAHARRVLTACEESAVAHGQGRGEAYRAASERLWSECTERRGGDV